MGSLVDTYNHRQLKPAPPKLDQALPCYPCVFVLSAQEAFDQIEHLIGPNKRAEFIRKAIDKELDAREGRVSNNSVQFNEVGDD
jgi:hypothetical protein